MPIHLAADLLEVLGEGDVVLGRKDGLVVQEVVCPLDEGADVVGGRQGGGLLVPVLVLPKVFKPGKSQSTNYHHSS